MTRLISSFFYIGLLPVAPGTWGSLVALPIAYGVFWTLGLPMFSAILSALVIIGWYAIAKLTHNGTDPDPAEIVIDEVIGQWVALLPILFILHYMPNLLAKAPQPMRWLVLIVIPFISFRFFDISKPWLVGWADRLHSPLGVIADDVFAGVFSWGPIALSLYLCLWYLGGI